ncbi:hypothetical protein IVB22_27960 [Bradyrhizobium sp. 190]|uniref:hypothetical protein n=1 Tax=Bradyrhizobium sp. 190 TaxID=2782658 RepID=UPI001FF76572|nr:hypothetical protein [Bradyrhizobium sp. 190]MCK1516276.1 hypothetical protein [Bradyrhizobium sp. 190]
MASRTRCHGRRAIWTRPVPLALSDYVGLGAKKQINGVEPQEFSTGPFYHTLLGLCSLLAAAHHFPASRTIFPASKCFFRQAADGPAAILSCDIRTSSSAANYGVEIPEISVSEYDGSPFIDGYHPVPNAGSPSSTSSAPLGCRLE